MYTATISAQDCDGPISGCAERAGFGPAGEASFQGQTNSLPMPRLRPRIVGMLTTAVDERRHTQTSTQKTNPKAQATSGRSSGLGYVEMVDETNREFADWNTTTRHGRVRLDVAHSAPNSTNVCGNQHFDRRVSEVIVHRPG